MNSIAYITLEEAIAKHDEIILASGGLLGLRDEGLLISALTMIQNDFYYSEYHEKLAHLIFSINKNHCFIDGNKRASLALGAIFLMKNGWSDELTKFFIKNMETIVVWLADNIIDKEEVTLFIMCLIYEFEKNNYFQELHSFVDEIRDGYTSIKIELLESIKSYKEVITKLNLSDKEVIAKYNLSDEDIEEIEKEILQYKEIIPRQKQQLAFVNKNIKFYNLLLQLMN